MSTEKKKLEITGKLCIPLTVGMSAFIDEGDGIRTTSRVLSIEERGQTEVAFETKNTPYLLHLQKTGGLI